MFPLRPNSTCRSVWSARADRARTDFRWLWLLIPLLGPCGANPATAAEPVDYLRQVKPVLKQRCYSCHGALRHRAKLRVDTAEALRRGGVSGQAVEPGDAESSLLIERLSASDLKLRMPPEGAPLSPEQIQSLRTWIDQGARLPAEESPEEDPRQHWAFLKPRRPDVPRVEDYGWSRNPIDAFLSAEHQRHGLKPLAPASPEVLIRRLYIDLVGLPPTREQLREFLDDPSDTVYERIVDRLLASPQHGERWARHWMDVWRYSDWYGRRAVPDVLNSYAMIWRWRDWIVSSLNRDTGYDEMVRQMLAADELNPTDEENLVATGYIVRNFYRWNYNSWMKDNVEHTAKAFLGLTVQCAHCHDHKYDPIRQEDYFALRACFEPIEIRHDRVAGEPDPGPYPKYVYGSAYRPIGSGMVRVFDEKLDAATFLYTRGESRNVVPNKPPIAPGVPAFLDGADFRIEPVKLPAEAAHPGLKSFVRHEEIDRRVAELARCERAATSDGERTAARAELDAILARQAADLVRFGNQPGDAESLGRAAAHSERRANQARLRLAHEQARVRLDRATQKPKSGSSTNAELTAARKALQTAQSAVEASLGSWQKKPGPYTPLSPSYPERSTGRRTALARWITSKDNPLAARVTVNHLWRWHFQQPLVATTYDFGRNGKRPRFRPSSTGWPVSSSLAAGA